MELCKRLEQILGVLRPAFSRETSFRWFVLFMCGVLLNTQPPAVTSYLNAIELGESYYAQALHWFESCAFSIDRLSAGGSGWLSEQRHRRDLRCLEALAWIVTALMCSGQSRMPEQESYVMSPLSQNAVAMPLNSEPESFSSNSKSGSLS